MAEMTIRLQTDPTTGKKDIIVSLESDEDLLPHEHEQQHRELVNKLIEGGLIAASNVGKIVVEREGEELPGRRANSGQEPQAEQHSQDA